MTDQEKKIMDKMTQDMEDIEIPESLNPENMEKLLWRKKRTSKKKIYGTLAASMALVVGLGVFSLQNMGGKNIEISSELQTAESYDEIYDCIKEYQKEQQNGFGFLGIGAEKGQMEGAVDIATPEGTASVITDGYSDTNIRTEGVGEADIAKTNGKYLFVLQENATEISIVDARTDKLEELGRIKVSTDAQISEFYVKDDKAIVFTSVSKSTNEDGNEVYIGTSTCIETYDISDVKNPKQIASAEQSGFYYSSRIVGDYIYTFSNHTVHVEEDKANIEQYIPMANENATKTVDIYMPEIGGDQYIVITSMNINNPDEFVDHKAVLTDYGVCYVSAENIYIYENIRNAALFRGEEDAVSDTVIRKFSYKDGKLKGVAKGAVKGWINDSFSIDEYKGNLRVVTTIEGQDAITNAVYVLDENMEIIGEINGIAKDERVYSARLYGDIGYFVTYRETDPLFSVDFSDPTNPQIIGKLKIPGFSEYLHFYGENQLVGIGMDTDEKLGITKGVKISMFDISNPTDVKEKHIYTIEDMYSSDVFWDYKAVLVDYEKNMIGFSCTDMFENYYIFSYDENEGFHKEMEEKVNGNSYLGTRGIYVGERFFVIKGNAIESYRMGTFEKIDDLLL